MKKIFASLDSTELSLFKNMMDRADIPCVLRNEQFSHTLPLLPFEAELWVLNDGDFSRARDLVASWRHPVAATAATWTCSTCGEKMEGQFSACWKCGGRKTEG